MKFLHLPVLAVLCVIAPSVASAITINSAEQLAAALKSATGGEVFDLAPGNYGTLTIKSRDFAVPITIRSVDPAKPATFGATNIRSSSGISFTGVEFSNPSPAATASAAVYIQGSKGISFKNVYIHGSLDGNPSNDAYGIKTLSSSNISVSGSSFSELSRGLVAAKTQNISLIGNDVQYMRTDGFNFSNVQGVTISGNRFSDFSPKAADHMDAIQFWTNGADASNTNITITGNLIVGKAGYEMQGIFLRDESKGQYPYVNVVIKNNTLVGTMWNGVMVTDGKNVSVTGNTVITLPGSEITRSSIRLVRTDGVVSGNTAKTYVIEESVLLKQANNTTNATSATDAEKAIAAWLQANVLLAGTVGDTPSTPTPEPKPDLDTPLKNAVFEVTLLEDGEPVPQFNTGFETTDPAVDTPVPELVDENLQPQSTSPTTAENVAMSAVPEPATWAQLLLGFGLVGWLMRRGRRPIRSLVG